jgi:hypothetical protein
LRLVLYLPGAIGVQRHHSHPVFGGKKPGDSA